MTQNLHVVDKTSDHIQLNYMEKLLALVFTYFFRTYTWNNGEVISESDTLVNLDVYV